MKDKRDENQFRSWLNEHQGILLKVAGSFTSSIEDRDDLVQEIMTRLWTTLPMFRGQSKPSTWIYRVALNLAITWQRDESQRRKRQVPLIEVIDTRETTTGNGKVLNRLYEQIRTLNEIDRSLILMSLDGCNYREMSDVIGLTESNVGVRLNRARKELSIKMAEFDDE